MLNENTRKTLEKMTKIALEKVEHYFTDFTCYDIPKIASEDDVAYVWMVRDTGTHLIPNYIAVGGKNLFKTVVANNDYYYFVKPMDAEVREVTKEELFKMYDVK